MEQKIIAVVAGREIKESDFEKFLQNVPREQQAYLSNPQFRQQCLDQFVALHMFAELGGEMKLEETEEYQEMVEKCQERYPCTDDNARSDERCSCDRRGCQKLL